MAKFSSFVKGTRARKRGVECTTLDGAPFVCDLRVLNAEEEGQCLAAGCKAARDAGGEPNESDLNYQLAFSVAVVALAATDPDSPDDKPVAFFEGGANEVRAHLDRERIVLLSTIHRFFQEQVSPTKHELSEEDFISFVIQTAAAEEGEDLPFETLPRFTRNAFIRSMAKRLLSLPDPKSTTGTPPNDAGVS